MAFAIFQTRIGLAQIIRGGVRRTHAFFPELNHHKITIIASPCFLLAVVALAL